MSGYEAQLRKCIKDGVTIDIDRDGAVSLKGRVVKVTRDGCVLATMGEEPATVRNVFIAFESIRGIATVDWDLENI